MIDQWLTNWLTILFFPGQRQRFWKLQKPLAAFTAGVTLAIIFALFSLLNYCRTAHSTHIGQGIKPVNSAGIATPSGTGTDGNGVDGPLSPAAANTGSPTQDTAAATLSRQWSYEVQFFTNNLPGSLDYQALAAAGIDKIIVRVFQDEAASGGLYFSNSLFRMLAPRLEEIAADMVFQKMEKEGVYPGPEPPLKLCAWMIARRFCWVHDTSLFDYQYQDGKRERIKKYDIFNPAAVEQVVQVFKELARKRIDSILIQDDFFLRYNEGFSHWGKDAFAQAAGSPALEKLMMEKDTPYNRKWKEIKRRQINKILREIIEGCREVAPQLKIGMNIYYETPVQVEHAEAWYAHNLEELLEAGLDYIYLMSYQRQIKEEMELDESANRQLFREIVEKAYDICGDKLVVKLQLRDWQSGRRISMEEAKAYLELIPPTVKHICFTPVKPDDIEFLEQLTRYFKAK